MISQTELKQILSAKFDFEAWKPVLEQMFLKIDYLTKEIQIDASLVKSGGQIGTIRLDDGRSLGLFRFEVADNIIIARNRKGLRDIAIKYVDQDIIHGALVFYYSTQQPDYRLTFVSKQTTLNADGEFTTQVTAPKRYTFLLGENEPCTTAASRLYELISRPSVYLADVTDAFSVERLNKEFFKAYKEQYQKFLNYLNNDTKANRDYVKKLLGRLVFLHFLQKKGWMGVPASNTKWEGGDKSYLLHLVERYNGDDRLLSDVLEPLFFETLNEKRATDEASPVLGENIKIPYLNGGLFDKDSLDRLDIDFPYSYFKDLMDFFAMYNFTIDENDPDDSEIGIDPEMLGHIFENLLEDNKDKGAFYTPKEIVQYMSRESVSQYLKTCTPDDLHTAIDTLVKQKQVEPLLQIRENARLVNRALETVKVCDPAIGSGAFPMGVLNVLFDCRHLLYGFIGENKPFSYADIKKQIIQNNIYGVDIEQGAVDIARLRFWLALVVDENEPQPLPNLDYKIMCGNSLLHRFALDAPFQDVLKDYNRENNTNYTLDDYRQWVYDYTNISDHTQKDDFRNRIEEIKHAFKTELSKKEKTKIAKVRAAIANLQMEDLFGSNPKDKEKELKKLQKQLKSLEQQRDEILSNKIYEHAFEWRFEFPALLDSEGNFTGFDIVIGNPPYINVQLMSEDQKAVFRRIFSCFYKRCDIFCLFVEMGLNLIKENGVVSFIIPSVVHSNLSYQPLRDIILNNHWLREVCYTGGDVFNAPTVDTTILIIQKADNRSITIKNALNFSDKKEKIVPADYFRTYNNIISVEIGDSNSVFDKLFNPSLPAIDQHFTVFQGIVTGNNTAFIFETEAEALEHSIDKSLLHPLCHGRDIEKYHVRNYDRRILYIDNSVDIDDYPTTKQWLLQFKEALDKRNEGKKDIINWCSLHRPRVKAELDLREKILIQNTRNEALKTRLVATLDNCSIYATQGINFIIPQTGDVPLRYLLGILNSKLLNYLFATKFLNLAIKAEYVKQVRIPTATQARQRPIIALVDTILNKKRENPQSDTSAEEIQIDNLVYHLYGLTYDEVLLIDPATPITQEEYEK